MQQLLEQGDYRELKPEALEELWVLSQIIRPGDHISATDERKVKVGSEQNPKQVKKLLPIELSVQRVQFQHEQLRVTGEIRNETEYTSVGSTHTVAYQVGDIIKLTKHQWLSSDQNLLQQALERATSKVLVVLLDKDDLVVAEYGSFSFQVLFEEHGLGSKKYSGQDIDEAEEKYQLIASVLERGYDQIFLAGPGHAKEGLRERLNSAGHASKTLQWSQVSTSALQQLLSHIQRQGLITRNQLIKEQEYVDEFLYRLQRNDRFTYGFAETEEATLSGRVETLLLTTQYLNRSWETGEYEALNTLMKTCEELRGTIGIIESQHEPGIQLDALTGIGALLRY